MTYPNLDEVKEYLKTYKKVPIFNEILEDKLTPIIIFERLKEKEENIFILESSDDSSNKGRYSFIGINPKKEIRIYNNEIKVINLKTNKEEKPNEQNAIKFINNMIKNNKSPNINNTPNLTGGLVGYFGFDFIRYIEKKLDYKLNDDLNMNDVNLFLFDEIITYDHLTSKIIITVNISSSKNTEKQYDKALIRIEKIKKLIYKKTKNIINNNNNDKLDLNIKSNLSKEEYVDIVEKAKKHIVEGDVFQVVLSRRFEVTNYDNPFNIYRKLRSSNPSPYLYYIKTKSYEVIGSSPELLVSVTNNIVKTKPIAGTIKRGLNEEEDKRNELLLLNDEKEQKEHIMLVDLGRNDIGKISKLNTVEVTDYMNVERYQKVIHLVSEVKGELNDNLTPIDALASILPAGTLSGAPKIKAVSIIDNLEKVKRGIYGGAIGYLGFNNNIDTCITIRTILVKDNKAYVQTGAGIVYDSIPEKEFDETYHKAHSLLEVLRRGA